MPLPRVRFTVRRMMVAVAIVAVSLAFVTMWNRAFTFGQIAIEHAERERAFRGTTSLILDYHSRLQTGKLDRFDPRPVDPDKPNASFDELAEDSERRADYHSQLTEKYRLAALYPWLPVPPDPPEPE